MALLLYIAMVVIGSKSKHNFKRDKIKMIKILIDISSKK